MGEEKLEFIVAEESLVSCDNSECEYRGEMFWCYLSQEHRCSMYLEYISREWC